MAVSCRDICELESLYRMKLLAGKEGLDKIVTWPYIKTMDTISEWIHGGEIVFVLGDKARATENELMKLIDEAEKCQISGLVLLTDEEHFRTIPKSIIRYANEKQIPLFRLPFMQKLIDITKDISKLILEDQIKNSEIGIKKSTVLELLLCNATKDELLYHCFKKISPLEEADKVTGSEYVRTLGIYLSAGNEHKYAAEIMYMHRNTMINRMKRIEYLLGEDIDDPEVRTEYYNIYSVLKTYGFLTEELI